MSSLFGTQGCQSGLGKGSALGLAACAALQASSLAVRAWAAADVGRSMPGRMAVLTCSTCIAPSVVVSDAVFHGVMTPSVSVRTFSPSPLEYSQKHGALGGFQCGGIAGVLNGEAARIGQDGVVQQAGEVILPRWSDRCPPGWF